MENAQRRICLPPCHNTKLTCCPASVVLAAAQRGNLNEKLHEGNCITPFVLFNQECDVIQNSLQQLLKGKEYRGRYEPY